MFKTIHSMKARKERGFTLIELLIVVAIIGILASIAVPAFLGQREKAKVRSVEAGAKGAVSEIQGLIDSLVSGDPFILLNTLGQQQCYQFVNPGSKTCQNIYNDTSSGTYTTVNDILSLLINHHMGKNEKSPFNGNNWLFQVAASGSEGSVILEASNDKTVRIRGFASDTTNAIFDTNVTAR